MLEVTQTSFTKLGADQDDVSPKEAPLWAAGGILAALGASSCCILPFVLFSLGVSGAWIGNLRTLARYQPLFIAAALAFLGIGFWRVYRRPKMACAGGSYCARLASGRIAKFVLWTAAVLVLAAATFPYTARLFIDP